MLINLLLIVCQLTLTTSWTDLNLPPKLEQYVIRGDAGLKQKCVEDEECPVKKEVLKKKRCFGYEMTCALNDTYTKELDLLKCNLRTNKPIVRNAERVFFDQADFGYLLDRSQLNTICSSESSDKSTLQCSENLQYCYAKNIFFDFRSFDPKGSARYRNDIINKGQVGGNCDNIYTEALEKNLNHKSYLQSWGHEFEYFESTPTFVVDNNNCDVIFDKPTIVMKLDASINMYHHFCDFINLYASMHINSSFNTDVDVVWWDTFSQGFQDHSFGVTWKAFTSHKPIELVSLAGKMVCFREAMFPLLARQRLGLYYNMPLTPGCSGSGLVHSFSEFILHRLQVEQKGPLLDKIRVTVLQRSTQYRRILNMPEIEKALQALPGVEVKVVDYTSKIAFLDQLEITHNSDIFIGMHGSGLTHLLFLPDWAAVLEIYNCDDIHCYYDLARLRGVKYFTWPEYKKHLIYPDNKGKHPINGESHKKFSNYRFDPPEVAKQVSKMVDYVRRHPRFQEERRKIRRKLKNEL